MRNLFLLLGLLTGLFFTGCEDDTESETILIVSPAELVKTAKSGEKILYTLTASSNSGLIHHITLNSYDPQNGLQTVLDSLIGQSVIRLKYQYTVPSFGDTTNVRLQFEATTETGFSASAVRFVKVAGGEVKLDELTGITLYSSASGRPDGFLIKTGALVNSHTLEKDSIIDIHAWQNPETDPDVLSHEWRSPSGMKFARFNSFDYAAATQLNVENAWQSGIKLNYIRDIQADDIILVGDDKHALGIIKVIFLADEPGASQDRYMFNIKRLRY